MRVFALLIFMLAGCSTVDIERSSRECLIMGGSPSYAEAGDARKFRCEMP